MKMYKINYHLYLSHYTLMLFKSLQISFMCSSQTKTNTYFL